MGITVQFTLTYLKRYFCDTYKNKRCYTSTQARISMKNIFCVTIYNVLTCLFLQCIICLLII